MCSSTTALTAVSGTQRPSRTYRVGVRDVEFHDDCVETRANRGIYPGLRRPQRVDVAYGHFSGRQAGQGFFACCEHQSNVQDRGAPPVVQPPVEQPPIRQRHGKHAPIVQTSVEQNLPEQALADQVPADQPTTPPLNMPGRHSRR
jgi:hypothetical protein